MQEIDTAIALNGFHCSVKWIALSTADTAYYTSNIYLSYFWKSHAFHAIFRLYANCRNIKSTPRIRASRSCFSHLIVCTYVWLFNASPQNVRVLAHFQFPDSAIYLNVSWKWIPRGVHPFRIIAHAAFTWYIAAPYFPSNIAQTCNMYLYSYISLTIDNTFHPNRLYALMNDSRDAMKMQAHRKHFFELTTASTNHRCVNHIVIKIYYAYVNR